MQRICPTRSIVPLSPKRASKRHTGLDALTRPPRWSADDARQYVPRKRRLQARRARSTGLPIRRAPGCLWAMAGSRLGTLGEPRHVANRALELLGKQQCMFIDRHEVGQPNEFANEELKSHVPSGCFCVSLYEVSLWRFWNWVRSNLLFPLISFPQASRSPDDDISYLISLFFLGDYMNLKLPF